MSDEIKRMADFLKSGATMLSDNCPECKSPLFKMKDELMCVKCNKPVIVIKPADDETGVIAAQSLGKLEKTVLLKIDEINSKLKIEKNIDRIDELKRSLSEWLTIIERVRGLQKSS